MPADIRHEDKEKICNILLDLLNLDVGEEFTLTLKNTELKYKRTQ